MVRSSPPACRRLVEVDGVALRLRLPAPAGTGRLANRALTLASQRKASHQSQRGLPRQNAAKAGSTQLAAP